jgi:hypothetical protein
MLDIFSRLRGQYLFTYKRINLYTSSHGNKLTGGCQRDTTSFGGKTGGLVVTTYGIMPVPGVSFRLQEVVL